MDEEDWYLEDFTKEIISWLEREDPPVGWFLSTLDWTERLPNEPHYCAEVDPDEGLPSWVAKIPNAFDQRETVACLYEIHPALKTVRCVLITCLLWPDS